MLANNAREGTQANRALCSRNMSVISADGTDTMFHLFIFNQRRLASTNPAQQKLDLAEHFRKLAQHQKKRL